MPLAEGIGEKKEQRDFVARDDYKKKKELEEARKAGTAPAEVDAVTGRDVSSLVPYFFCFLFLFSFFFFFFLLDQPSHSQLHLLHSLVLQTGGSDVGASAKS
jgi:hypothetical protein